MSLGVRIGFNNDGTFFIDNGSSKTCRDQKGKSLLTRTKDFTAIDIETTGLSPEYDCIIELAAIRYRNGQPSGQFQQLVNPEFKIDEFITELTGITNEMLSGAPKIDVVLPDFLSFIADDIIVGHNVNFDVNFLYDNCQYEKLPPFKNDFVDTMRIARRLHKDWPNHRLDTMIDKLSIGSRDLHRALNDTSLTAESYLVMIEDPSWDFSMKDATAFRAKDIVAKEGMVREDSPLYGKVCVFTGALESFTRKEAMQIVADIGGICGDSVTKKTNILVLGNNDYCKAIKDGKSSKQKKAEQLILSGADLQIVPETVFLEMIASE